MITDKSAIKFSNERIRPVCNRVAALYYAIVTLSQEYQFKGMESLIPNDASEIIDDGAPNDGRTQITGEDVRKIIDLANDLIAMGTGQNTKMPYVLKIADNVAPNL